MRVDEREEYIEREIEGFAEAVKRHSAEQSYLFSVEQRIDADRIRPTIHTRMMEPKFPQPWGVLILILQTLAYGLKALLLIANKLDRIFGLLWEQELRERNREGR